MGGGSTIAAALSVSYESIGREIDPTYYRIAVQAIPTPAVFPVNRNGYTSSIRMESDVAVVLPLLSSSHELCAVVEWLLDLAWGPIPECGMPTRSTRRVPVPIPAG